MKEIPHSSLTPERKLFGLFGQFGATFNLLQKHELLVSLASLAAAAHNSALRFQGLER